MDAMLVLIICGIVFLLYLRCGAGGCRWLSPNPILNFVIPVNGPWSGFFRAGVKIFLGGLRLEAGGWMAGDCWTGDGRRKKRPIPAPARRWRASTQYRQRWPNGFNCYLTVPQKLMRKPYIGRRANDADQTH